MKTQRRRMPPELRCDYALINRKQGVYGCRQCGCWTANLPLYKYDVCKTKERRRAGRDRRAA